MAQGLEQDVLISGLTRSARKCGETPLPGYAGSLTNAAIRIVSNMFFP